jgi:hypothetical protein
MENLLTKSDFLIAKECPTKLYYRKLGMPTSEDGNEFRNMLAESGYAVGKMAQLYYPKGVLAGSDINTEAAIEATKALLESENITLFEATIKHGAMLVRIDILQKEGNTLRIIEVKSKSFSTSKFSGEEAKGNKYFGSEWNSVLHDVAFQKLVLASAYPEAVIESWLMLPDKDKITNIEGLSSMFVLQETTNGAERTDYNLTFTGDAEKLCQEGLLSKVRVDKFITPAMAAEAYNYEQAVLAKSKIQVPISTKCNNCNYTVTNAKFPKSGYEQCWGDLAYKEPHILKLSYLGSINKKDKIVDKLIQKGKVLQTDIPKEILSGMNPSRPFFQVFGEEEFLNKVEFSKKSDAIEYPLHFIDFETTMMVIPPHAGMRPYEYVAFQWSCHTIKEKGAPITHSEWINSNAENPNLEFLRSLKDCIGDKGTVLTWSKHESTTIDKIGEQLNVIVHEDLIKWSKSLNKNSSRVLDMCKFTNDYYHHPLMGGRTSIKVTLPAVLAAMDKNKTETILGGYNLFDTDDQGQVINPYKLLPELIIGDKVYNVSDGTGAIKAYKDMIYGDFKDDAAKAGAIKKSLLQYCHLDTLAMVLIWERWNELANQQE